MKYEDKKSGRPIHWTNERKEIAIKEIFEWISSGHSLRSLIDNSDRCIIPAMSTFLEWVDGDALFANQYAHAMKVREELLFDEILSISDKQGQDVIQTENGEIINHNVINRSRLQIDARKWVLSKMNPKKYGDKTDITTGGDKLPITATIDLSKLSQSALEELEKAQNT